MLSFPIHASKKKKVYVGEDVLERPSQQKKQGKKTRNERFSSIN